MFCSGSFQRERASRKWACMASRLFFGVCIYIHTHTHTHTHAHTHTHIPTYVCTHTYTHAHIYIHIHTCIQTHILLIYKQTDTNIRTHTFTYTAARCGHTLMLRWMLENGSSVHERSVNGYTALLCACMEGQLVTCSYLLEHGGADITDATNQETTVWGMLEDHIIEPDDAAAVMDLLRIMVLRGAPPAELVARLAPEIAQVVDEGARLRAALPAYLAQRRALLDAHCPLLPPLRSVVYGYEEPTTTEELWETGLGTADPPRAARSHAEVDVDVAESPPRRSDRLRQRTE
jgi:hypothetical protein